MWSQYLGGPRDFELVLEMSSNPCLTFLLVYSALITIALMVTSTLLATSHSTVVCKGGKGGEVVEVNHYAVVDASKDEIDEGKPEQCKCHCNCSQKEVITGIEVFVVTSVGIIIIAITVYSCLALRYCILKQRKLNVQLAMAEAQRVREENDRLEKEKRLKLIEELKSEAIELGTMQKMTCKQDEY